MRKISFLMAALLITAVLVCMGPVLAAAKAAILLPLNRTAYQTNELIDISVTRSDAQALQAGNLVLSVTGTDGSKLSFTFPVKAVSMVGNDASDHGAPAPERLAAPPRHLSRDGECGRHNDAVEIDHRLHPPAPQQLSHRPLEWSGRRCDGDRRRGRHGLNLILGGIDEPSIRGGVDIMGCDIMGGGHQFDLKLNNDWSDPYVYLGANQRAMDVAFSFRTMPNAIGAHLYDEPGLTWLPNPHTGQWLPTTISPRSAGRTKAPTVKRRSGTIEYESERPGEEASSGNELNDFKLGFMDAFWKSSKQALERMKPGYLEATQSQYGWMALYDGYYFNVVRSLPIVSGHGGYSSYWLRNFNPSFYLEMSLPRQLDKPNWYLPEWEGEAVVNSDAFRLEHNLSFITGIQGMSTPPTVNIGSPCAAGIIESNKLFTRLGTIFARPDYTPQDLAVLYSKSNAYTTTGGIKQAGALSVAYTASKLAQYPISVIVDEDIIDGTLATNHKAVLLTGIDYLDPAVVSGLEAFIKAGGVVLTTAECTVNIAGATKLDVTTMALSDKAVAQSKATTDKDKKKAIDLHNNAFKAQMDYAEPLAQALKAALLAKGIRPAFGSNIETIAPGKQVRGEIEYDFAVNFTPEGYGENPTDAGYGKPDQCESHHRAACGWAPHL